MKKIEIIAECGINHGGNLATAMKMVEHAKRSGADVVKFQLVDPNFYKKGSELYDIFTKTYLTIEEHVKLKSHCDLLGIEYLCTPSDVNMAKHLVETVGVKRLKVASDSAKDPKLLRYIAQINIPYIISTGHIQSANLVKWSNKLDPKLATVLHCVSEYPTPLEKAKIQQITRLKKLTPYRIGYSDHTEGIYAPLLAIGAGAEVIEKHFMIDKDCIDAPVSIMPWDFQKMVDLIRKLEVAR